MAYNKAEFTKVKLGQNYKIIYQKKEIWGGAISWYSQVKIDKLGKDLIIETSAEYDNVIINGTKLDKI